MTTSTAKDAFQEAINLRRKYPLTSGVDKLHDVRSSFLRMQETMCQIREYLKNPGNFKKGQILGYCCTTDDKAYWINSIPALVARRLGYDILPAIAALTNDGLSKRDTDIALATAKQRAKALLEDCERQQTQLKRGISVEYNMIKTGYSEVHGLLVEADRIAEDALQVLEYASQTSRLLPPNKKSKVT